MGKYKNKNRQEFLLTFFPAEEKYEVKEVNGFILVKYFSNNTHTWEVAIYTPESFKERQQYNQIISQQIPL
jgi:hypothetical protein